MVSKGVHPGPHTSQSHPTHRKYPYLLRELAIVRPCQVWNTDITYIRLPDGFVYLTAVIDWFSRFVLSSRLSNSLEGSFCLEALKEALDQHGQPEIFNTDQGLQFTCAEFVEAVESRGIRFSVDGRGRALDNVFVERLWRSLKHEEIYLHDYQGVSDVRTAAALDYNTPHEVHSLLCSENTFYEGS